MEKHIKIKVNDVGRVWGVLNNLIPITEQPFKGKARRLAFKLQPEVKFIESASKKDLEAVKDDVINLGEQIPPPDVYIDEYKEVLEMLCGTLPERHSQVEQLLNKSE